MVRLPVDNSALSESRACMKRCQIFGNSAIISGVISEGVR